MLSTSSRSDEERRKGKKTAVMSNVCRKMRGYVKEGNKEGDEWKDQKKIGMVEKKKGWGGERVNGTLRFCLLLISLMPAVGD